MLFEPERFLWVVLGGELAVPCNLHSAIAGLNSLPRYVRGKSFCGKSALRIWALCNADP